MIKIKNANVSTFDNSFQLRVCLKGLFNLFELRILKVYNHFI